ALVLTGAARGRAEFPAAAGQSSNLVPLAAVSGGLMTMVAVFIVASTLALSVQLRRRQIALLRAVGATPGQLRRLVLSETVLLAVPAAGLAVLLTQAIGRRLLAAFADHGLAAGRLGYHQGYIPTLSGAAIAVLTGVIAALVAARSAIRVRPVEALATDDAPQPWLTGARLAFGVLTLAGAVALALVTALAFDGPGAASTAPPSAVLWVTRLAPLPPPAPPPGRRLLGPPPPPPAPPPRGPRPAPRRSDHTGYARHRPGHLPAVHADRPASSGRPCIRAAPARRPGHHLPGRWHTAGRRRAGTPPPRRRCRVPAGDPHRLLQ